MVMNETTSSIYENINNISHCKERKELNKLLNCCCCRLISKMTGHLVLLFLIHQRNLNVLIETANRKNRGVNILQVF